MNTDKMELYHFHKEKNHDRFWKERGIIKIPENFKSRMYERYLEFSTSKTVPGYGNVNFHDLVVGYFQSGGKDLTECERLLKMGWDISFYANMFKRENVLENYRLANKPQLPSRLHSVYLTDEKGIEYWKRAFSNENLTLYRVEVEGNIFKTNEQLLPEEELNYEDAYNNSYNYWNPNFKKVPDYTNEYLAQGQIKILEKINNI